jgi:hypothetical protein
LFRTSTGDHSSEGDREIPLKPRLLPHLGQMEIQRPWSPSDAIQIVENSWRINFFLDKGTGGEYI